MGNGPFDKTRLFFFFKLRGNTTEVRVTTRQKVYGDYLHRFANCATFFKYLLKEIFLTITNVENKL